MDHDHCGYPRHFTRLDSNHEVISTLADIGLDCIHHQNAEVPYMNSTFFIGVFEKTGKLSDT